MKGSQQDHKLPPSWSSRFLQDTAASASGNEDPLAQPPPPQQQQPPPPDPPRPLSSSEVEELRNQLQALQRERAEDHCLIKDLESRLRHSNDPQERPPPFAPGTVEAEALPPVLVEAVAVPLQELEPLPPATNVVASTTTTVGEQQQQQQVHHRQIDPTRSDPEAQQEQEQREDAVDDDGNDNDDDDNNNKRQGGSSSSSNTRPRHRRRILAAVGILLLVVVAVIVAMMVTGGMSSGGSSNSSTNTDPARLPTPPDTTTTTTTTTEPTTVPPPLPETAVSWKQLGADLNGVAADDWFGYSIALSADGTILAVGAPLNDANGISAGQVRLFAYDTTTTTASGGQWKQLGTDLNGGTSVALSADGTILAVGATGGPFSGHVRVFLYSKENHRWKQLGADLNGEADFDYFGESVALSSDGTILAVGAHGNDDNGVRSGQVHVFQYGKAEGRWIQLGVDLKGQAAGDGFGISVALSEDGTILAAGGWRNDGNGYRSGHARVFQYDAAGVQWLQLGADLDGKAAGDWFGGSVALSSSGFILAVGGPNNDANGAGSGHVRVFEYSTASNKWNQLGGDLGGEAGDDFGQSVALSSDGTVLVVGAAARFGSASGDARIFHYNKANEQWNKLGEDLNGKAAEDRFGWSVALSADGTIVASGAYKNDDNGEDSGQARVFQRKNKSDDP